MMSAVKQKSSRMVKVVTVDGARFEGEVSSRDGNGIYLRVSTPIGKERFVFVAHHAISHLEIKGWN